MTSITTPMSTVARTCAFALALACLSGGLVGAGATAASAHEGSAPSLRGGGSDDPAGDDHGGESGGDDDRAIVTGSCSAGADWKLKVKTDDGRLEVEGEIDSNAVAQQWRWAIRHNGSVSDRGSATTTGRSGSFSVERTIVDIAGTDRVVFRASREGQTCRGVINY